jgi:hypothetical protein
MTYIRSLAGQFTRSARLTLLLIFVLGLCPWAARGADADAVSNLSPLEFKAAFLSKVLAYVKWPADTLPKDNQPIVVGLFGYDSFNGLIQKILAGQTINDHQVVVEVLTDTNRIGACQVLYVPDDKLAEWLKLKPEGAGHGVLTVGADSTGQFLKSGGIFNLLVDERKLEISLGNADKAGLSINSKLKKISIVK